jgi:ABC-2 type transport system permease protein
MKILSIVWKDIRIFFKEPGYLIYLVVLPLVFIQLFTTLFSASVGSSISSEKIRLVVVNQDTDGDLAREFLRKLEETGTFELLPATLQEAEADFKDTRITRYLVIPADFTKKIESGQPSELTFQALDSLSITIQSMKMIIEGVGNSLQLERNILDSLTLFGEMQSSAPLEFQIYDIDVLTRQAQSQFQASDERPLVAVKLEYPQAATVPEEDDFSMVQFSVPGFTVLFAFLVAQASARSIYDEKKTGSFRRLLAAPLSKLQLLSGKLLPNLLIVLFQILIIFLSSIILLPLTGVGRLSLGEHPAALLAISFCVALCSTSLGILIAAIARTEAQIGGVSALFLWLMGFLGGTMVPLDIMNSPMLNTIARFIPHSYAVTAYKGVLIQGADLIAVLPALGILVGFSLIFFLIGLWRFDFN